MSRHVADKANPQVPTRAAHFTRIARQKQAHPAAVALYRRPEDTPAAQRLRAFVTQAAAETQPSGRHVADDRQPPPRSVRPADLVREDGLHPAIEALHSRSRDGAEVARTRAFLRQAWAEAAASGQHAADGPRTPAPSRPARYLEMARAQGLHPSVRALRTRRGDSTALIRLREFLRIARGDHA